MIVDDSGDIQALLQLILAKAPDFVVVGTASDGAEAISKARELQPDLVLLDVKMPVLDGEKALPGVRAVAPRAKVVFLTGLDESEVKNEGPVRADAVLSKPTALMPSELLHALRLVVTKEAP